MIWNPDNLTFGIKSWLRYFKRLGIIEQWGNGLKLISGELSNYPEIGLEWKEPGMGFRVIFFQT